MGEKLTTHERVELVFMFGRDGATYRSVAEEFNRTHPEREKPLNHTTVCRLIKRFQETGSVADRERCGRRKSATDEETSTMVLANVGRSPVKSVRKISQELTISKSSVHRILKTQKFHPYKVHLVQALHGDDTDRRLEFCEWVCNHLDSSILFSDEAIFHLNGQVNRHNMRYWSEVNPNWNEEGHHQTNPKIMVWAGIWEEEIVGPYFFNTSNVTGETYLGFLQTFLFEYLTNVPVIRRQNLLFQQDGAPPHFAICVRDYLNQTFPERWIGRRGPVEWPPRSPDLSPLDYFLWGHLKSVVYQNRPRTLDDLKDAIITECQKITTETLIRVKNSFIKRIDACVQAEGGQFEHLL